MNDNFVHIVGEVKHDSEAVTVRQGLRMMDFCLVVKDFATGKDVFVDCFASDEVVESLEGFVSEGETLEVTGHLTYRTVTTKYGNRISRLYVFAEEVNDMEDEDVD